jgi:hypothetical protein
MEHTMAVLESELYAPLKTHLEYIGFEVKAEVGKCDIVALRNNIMIAVEMKLSFGLPVIYQALERLSACDLVYVATGVPDGRKARSNWDKQVPYAERLCKMLGVGLIEVRDGIVTTLVDPETYAPKKSPKLRNRLLSEFTRRSGDHNIGGTTKRPRVTAYREDCLKLARFLSKGDTLKVSTIRKGTGLEKSAGMLRSNVYGWFDKKCRGEYVISSSGIDALFLYADVIATQVKKESHQPA